MLSKIHPFLDVGYFVQTYFLLFMRRYCSSTCKGFIPRISIDFRKSEQLSLLEI